MNRLSSLLLMAASLGTAPQATASIRKFSSADLLHPTPQSLEPVLIFKEVASQTSYGGFKKKNAVFIMSINGESIGDDIVEDCDHIIDNIPGLEEKAKTEPNSAEVASIHNIIEQVRKADAACQSLVPLLHPEFPSNN